MHARMGSAMAILVLASACVKHPQDNPQAFSWTNDIPAGDALHIRNGEVKLSVVSLAPGASVRGVTTNGSVRAELPATLEGALDLTTTNGNARSDFAIMGEQSGRRIRGPLGGSSRPVRLRTVNGDVH